jgi:hypothetical protein
MMGGWGAYMMKNLKISLNSALAFDYSFSIYFEIAERRARSE